MRELGLGRKIGGDQPATIPRGFGHEAGQTVIALRADHDVDHRRARGDLASLGLGDAASDRDQRLAPFGLAPRTRGWIEFVLGTPVVLWVGWPILAKFARSVASWNLNMYSLIGLGVALAYLFSLAAVLLPGLFPQEFREHDGSVGTYFEAAAVIVTLILEFRLH